MLYFQILYTLITEIISYAHFILNKNTIIRSDERMNDNVFQVGKCENSVNCFQQYLKGSKLIKYIQVSNRHVSEGLLLKILKL